MVLIYSLDFESPIAQNTNPEEWYGVCGNKDTVKPRRFNLSFRFSTYSGFTISFTIILNLTRVRTGVRFVQTVPYHLDGPDWTPNPDGWYRKSWTATILFSFIEIRSLPGAFDSIDSRITSSIVVCKELKSFFLISKLKKQENKNLLLANEILEVSFYTLIKIHFWSKVLLRLWSEIGYWNNFKMDQNRNSACDLKFQTKLKFWSAFKFFEWALLVRIQNKTFGQKLISNTFLDQKMVIRVI